MGGIDGATAPLEAAGGCDRSDAGFGAGREGVKVSKNCDRGRLFSLELGVGVLAGVGVCKGEGVIVRVGEGVAVGVGEAVMVRVVAILWVGEGVADGACI